MDYHQKYLKYKNKYLELKNNNLQKQSGGLIEVPHTVMDKDIISRLVVNHSCEIEKLFKRQHCKIYKKEPKEDYHIIKNNYESMIIELYTKILKQLDKRDYSARYTTFVTIGNTPELKLDKNYIKTSD